ncbi:10359_t:CDS:1 [Ambispora gerdemannii]|uniref:10359_t:CDS:1 n=1 Tax=Ambispora gerdemannii TaxID=144530 RepID=A0A9N9GXV7_9GLOM|nr:10359_t:CDS:1 [Ambispora gerdemannii]
MSNKQDHQQQLNTENSHRTIHTTRLNPFTTATSSIATTVEQIHAQPNKKFSTFPSLHREEVSPTIYYSNSINKSTVKKDFGRRKSVQSIFHHRPLFERGELVKGMNSKLRNKEEKYDEMEIKGKELENEKGTSEKSKIEIELEGTQEDSVVAMVKIARDDLQSICSTDISDSKWQ